MKLAVLDGYTANPGDLSWGKLEALAEVQVYDRTPAEQVVERAREAEVVLTNKTVLTREAIAALPKLRYVGVLATGYNVVDVEAARERGIPVCNVPEYSTATVAQAVFALLLEFTNRVGHYARTVEEGRWSACPDFSYWDSPLMELLGKTLGILGFGRIGQAVARIGLAFGMKVLAFRRREAGPVAGVECVSIERLFRESDVLTLHCPLTPETREIVNAERLGWMKSSALLINTARGPLVHEADLAQALAEGKIAGAALDVLSVEPPRGENPLLRAPNCLVTPHQAWATREARARLLDVAAENVRAWMAGRPVNVVNA
jgi:glycerate dehydrogenase